MKGFGMIKIGEAGWLEKDRPTAGPLDAILRPVAISPCTSDVHMSHGGSGEFFNVILGHEAIAEIVEVGSLVKNFKPGDTVVVATTTPDWLVPNVQGKYHQHDIAPMGSFKFLTQKDGVMAEFFHVNQADANLVRMPENMPYESALMVVDMMSTGFHGAELANIEIGDTVVVMGIGPVGLMAVAGARLRGAGRIIAIGTRPNCVAIAKEYGATDIVSYKEGDVVEQIMTMTGGGVDAVIIAGGGPEAFKQAVTMVKAGGTVSNLNYFDVTDVLSMEAYLWGLGMANKDIRGGFCPGGARRIEKLLEVVRHGRVDPSKLITHKFEGFDQIENAFHLMDEKPRDLIKPVVFINW